MLEPFPNGAFQALDRWVEERVLFGKQKILFWLLLTPCVSNAYALKKGWCLKFPEKGDKGDPKCPHLIS